jgi:septal ring factor EnvC (AmiA/AmiB activator)
MSDVEEKVDQLQADLGVLKVDVAVLKADVSVLKRDLHEVRQDIKDVRQDIRDVRAHQERDFRLLFGTLIGVTLGLAGLMAKGFGWLH